MKKPVKKSNPILEPYLPRFKDLLWIYAGFEEAISDDLKQFYSVKYRVQLDYFRERSNWIIDHLPSRKQVDAIMEMLYFVMVWHFFIRANHYDHLLESVFTVKGLKAEEKEEIQKRYDKTKRKMKIFADKYIEKTKIEGSMLPEDENAYNALYASNQFASFLKASIQHYLDVANTFQAPELIDFNWSGYNMHDLITELRNREEKIRKALKKQRKLLPQGQTWIEFDDGFRWTYLPRSSCRDLAREGDHCATVESWMGSNFGRLLYLTDSEGELILTASYAHLRTYQLARSEIAELEAGIDFGVLGQIRGNYNSKPKKQYLKYIAALLCDDRVLFHIPDSYRSDDQFLIEDLDDLQRGIIEQRNPSVFEWRIAADFAPYSAIKTFLHLMDVADLRHLKSDLDETRPQPEAMISVWSGSTHEFLKELNQRQAADLWHRLESGDELIYFETQSSEVESFIENLDDEDLKKLCDKMVERKSAPDDCTAKGVIAKLDADDEIYWAIARSVHRGYEAGSETNAFKQVTSRIEDLIQTLRDVKGLTIDTKEGFYGDDAIQIKITVQAVLTGLQEAHRLHENYNALTLSEIYDENESDFHEVRDCFQDYFDYDSDAALEDFFGYQIHDL